MHAFMLFVNHTTLMPMLVCQSIGMGGIMYVGTNMLAVTSMNGKDSAKPVLPPDPEL